MDNIILKKAEIFDIARKISSLEASLKDLYNLQNTKIEELKILEKEIKKDE